MMLPKTHHEANTPLSQRHRDHQEILILNLERKIFIFFVTLVSL